MTKKSQFDGECHYASKFDSDKKHCWQRLGVDHGDIIWQCAYCHLCTKEPCRWLP